MDTKAVPVRFLAQAYNQDQIKGPVSDAVTFVVAPSTEAPVKTAYVLTVGVGLNESGWNSLAAPTSAREASKIFRDTLASAGYKVVVRELINDLGASQTGDNGPSKKNFLGEIHMLMDGITPPDGARSLAKKPNPQDVVVVYIAAHGYATGKEFYWIPSDTGKRSGIDEDVLGYCAKGSKEGPCVDAAEFLRRAVSADEMATLFEGVDSGEILVVLDTCHAGAVTGTGFLPGPFGDVSFGQISYDKGIVLLLAAEVEEPAAAVPSNSRHVTILVDTLARVAANLGGQRGLEATDLARAAYQLWPRLAAASGSARQQEFKYFDFRPRTVER
jgi:hypothetical protein